MLKAKNIIYGYCKYTNPPKNKYLISLYRSEELNIIAVFPTSQRRAGVAEPKHGCNIREGQIVSIYAFYTSPLTPLKYKPIFDKILQEYFSQK